MTLDAYPHDLFWLPESAGFLFKGERKEGGGFDLYLFAELGAEPALVSTGFTIPGFPTNLPHPAWVMP